MADTPQFDPIAQYRQQYQDPRSDQEIGQKLLDPQNFQKAFPQYDYSSPDATQRISAHMQSYYNTKFPATTPGTSAAPSHPAPVNATWNKFVGTTVPTVLAGANKLLTQPIGQTLGLQSKPMAQSVEEGATGIKNPYWRDTAKIGAGL